MKILKILGIAAGVHALALILLLSSPGCSNTKAATPDSSPISPAPSDAAAPSGAAITMPDSVGIRYSPTRPGTTVASALETQPVSDVTPVTTYTVGKGDTLSTIARKNKLSKADLASANNLKPGSILHQGQKLILPSKQAPAAASAPVAAQAKANEAVPAEKVAAESTKHVVKPGETLGGIARKYGVKQGEIAVANNITDPRKIQPGQELVIPARSTSTTGKAARGAKPSTSETADNPPKAQGPSAADQDLDAGLKPTGTSDVPVVKIEDSSGTQPKNP
jgi:LysM repeat protein